jgi:hypothetical protein
MTMEYNKKKENEKRKEAHTKTGANKCKIKLE